MIKKYKDYKPMIESCGGSISSCGGGMSSCGGGYTEPSETRSEKIRKNRNKKLNAIFDENTCVDCGEVLVEGAKFCHSCGYKI